MKPLVIIGLVGSPGTGIPTIARQLAKCAKEHGVDSHVLSAGRLSLYWLNATFDNGGIIIVEDIRDEDDAKFIRRLGGGLIRILPSEPKKPTLIEQLCGCFSTRKKNHIDDRLFRHTFIRRLVNPLEGLDVERETIESWYQQLVGDTFVRHSCNEILKTALRSDG